MKTIYNGQAVRMSTWNVNRRIERAKVMDMGVMAAYKDDVTDADRVYAAARTIFLSNAPVYYEQQDREYDNPMELVNGEIVRLEANNKLYRVVDMHPSKWSYIADPIHFELVK